VVKKVTVDINSSNKEYSRLLTHSNQLTLPSYVLIYVQYSFLFLFYVMSIYNVNVEDKFFENKSKNYCQRGH
jgi:hypothetical protein